MNHSLPHMSTKMISGCERIVGIDFDNTLVTYDELFHEIAVERGLISVSTGKSKKQVKDRICQSPNGELEWEKLQALVYGPRISEGRFARGAREFLSCCRQERIKVYIISHKTVFASRDEKQINLRAAALNWMATNKFFQPDGAGLNPGEVFFGATRQEKIGRIRQLGCTHFIDDLEETFLEPGFPVNVEKFLYAPHSLPTVNPEIKIFRNWQGIYEYFFAAST